METKAWILSTRLVFCCIFVICCISICKGAVGKYAGPSFITLGEARDKQILKRGDVIQVRRNGYMHAVLFEDYKNCFHVTKDDNTDDGVNFNQLLKKGINGTSVYIRKHPLKDILRKGDDISGDDDRQPQYDSFRVNNQEEEARKRGVNLEKIDLGGVFKRLGEIISKRPEEKYFYHFSAKNCECYAYEWKYGIDWSPQVEFWKRLGYSLLDWFFVVFLLAVFCGYCLIDLSNAFISLVSELSNAFISLVSELSSILSALDPRDGEIRRIRLFVRPICRHLYREGERPRRSLQAVGYLYGFRTFHNYASLQDIAKYL